MTAPPPPSTESDDPGPERPDARRLQGSAYVDDDGSADAALRTALEAWGSGAGSRPAVLAALVDARLLVPVVAVLGEVEVGDDGLARDKTSDMAAVLLAGADGRMALVAFTDLPALAAWDPTARPVPVAAPLAAATAVQEGAAALVLDVAGPHRFVLDGDDLHRFAAGWRPVRLEDGGWGWLGRAGD
ncbi:SseB family protein [Nocardioides caeni]|uniref:SseB family protein n=1 Tax=Nocardioides caeni TaxID=574700 RepID=A0A4V6T628_9ACTN|nr:SseB family protein [Nocardioides caeni]THV18706.1 SseB family protein [Nocardioides caeni]